MVDPRDRALELIDIGVISAEELVTMCLKYMSAEAVADMLDANELGERFQEDEYDGQPDEAQEWYDFDPDC